MRYPFSKTSPNVGGAIVPNPLGNTSKSPRKLGTYFKHVAVKKSPLKKQKTPQFQRQTLLNA